MNAQTIEPVSPAGGSIPYGSATAWAHALGAQAAVHAAGHDRDGTFVTEAFELLRREGYLALAVPADLGGHGVMLPGVARAQAALAMHCPSTALASAMHQHSVVTAAWRRRRGAAGVEGMLKRVANEQIVVLSTGGSDGTHPSAVATRVEGGYRVSGRKRFVSQSVAGTVLSSWAVYDDPAEGRVILGFGVPMSAAGVTILDTWDTLGMRGTASNDVQLTDVFVADAQVSARRPYGVMDPLLRAAFVNGLAIISGVYLGVAEAAREAAIGAVRGSSRAGDPLVRRQAGELEAETREARWAFEGMLATLGDDPDATREDLATVMLAKRAIAAHGQRAIDLSMDLVGGSTFYRGSAIERAYRDFRAIRFHPLTPEEALVDAGELALAA